MSLLFRLILSAGLLALLSLSAHAQSSSSSDPEIQKLQNEKDKAQLQADLAKAEQQRAEAQAAAFKAQLGSLSTANLPQGTIKTDSVVIEANYLAYMAAHDAAAVMVKEIGCPPGLLFYSAKELDGLQALATLQKQMDQFVSGSAGLFEPVKLREISHSILVSPSPKGSDGKNLYVLEPAAQAEFAPALAFAAIDAAMSIASLFKTDTDIHGVATPADDLALQSLVARELKTCKSNVIVIHPTYFNAPLQSALLDKLQKLAEISSNADAKSHDLDTYVRTPIANAVDALRKLPKVLGDLKNQQQEIEDQLKKPLDPKPRSELGKKLREIQSTLEKLSKQNDDELKKAGARSSDELLSIYLTDQILVEARIQSLKNLTSKTSDLSTALTKVDPSGGTPLQVLLRVESLEKQRDADSSVLVTKFVSLGGNNIIKKGAFSTSLRFTGGAIVEYLLIDKNGLLSKSGVIECYGGNVSEDDLVGDFANTNTKTTCRPALN